MKLLRLGYSDDIFSVVFLLMIAQEDIKPSFQHPLEWESLTISKKVMHLLIVNFLKMLAIVDFSNMSFKEDTITKC